MARCIRDAAILGEIVEPDKLKVTAEENSLILIDI
jgi:hypothetical protein